MDIVAWVVKNEASFLLILVRVAAFMGAMPFFGSQGVPRSIKVWLTIGIALVLLPAVKVEIPPLRLAPLLVGLVGEVLVGLTIGLGARLIFAAVEMAGEMIGLQFGFGLANVLDPTTDQQVSLIGQFQGMLATMIFFILDAHHFVFRALVHSFELVPFLGFYLSGELMKHLVSLGSGMFLLGVKVGIPVILTLLLTQIAMGIMGRVVPQMNILLFGFTVTIGIGLLMIAVSLPLFVELVGAQVSRLGEVFSSLLNEMGPRPAVSEDL